VNDYEDTIPLVTPKEVAEEIRTNLNPKKAPGFNMITGSILTKLQRKGLVKLTALINASVRLKHVPASCIRSNHVTKTWKKPHRCKIISANCTATYHVEVVLKTASEMS
jgi:hypothetical protein